MLEFLQRHTSCKDHWIHREFLGSEMGIEKVERENKSCCQQGFVAMNDGGDVDEITRQKFGKEFGEPQDQSRKADHSNAPEHSEIIEFLPIRPSAIIRSVLASEEPANGLEEFFHIVPGWRQAFFFVKNKLDERFP